MTDNIGSGNPEQEIEKIASGRYAAEKMSVTLFNKKKGVYVELMGVETQFEAPESGFYYELNDPYYIEGVFIDSTKDLQKELSFSYQESGIYHKIDPISKDDKGGGKYRYGYKISKIVNGFSIKSTFKLYIIPNNPEISNVEVFGVPYDELIESAKLYDKLIVEKNSAISLIRGAQAELKQQQEKNVLEKKNLESDLAAINAELSLKKDALVSLQKNIDEWIESGKKASDNLSEIEKNIAIRSAVISGINQDIEAKNAFKNERDNEILVLNNKIIELKQSLRELQGNKNLFTDELSSFAEQGNLNIRLYAFLSLIPMTIISIISVRLINNAEIFAISLRDLGFSSTFSALLARMPFALLSGVAIVACLKIIKPLFDRIFLIHAERLILSELSIIAKDTSSAAAKDLSIDEEAIYDIRIRQKMDLIKRHLSKKIDTNDDFGPYAKDEGELGKGDEAVPPPV